MLYLSAGVVRIVEREDRPTLLFRAAGSAGGRFPFELYVAARGVEGCRRRPLVRPRRPCAGAGRPAAPAARHDAGPHRHPVAHRLALLASAGCATSTGTRARCWRRRSRSRLGRPRAAAVHALPRRAGHAAGRRRRRARVPARARRPRPQRARRSGRAARRRPARSTRAPLEFPLVTLGPARRRRRPPRRAVAGGRAAARRAAPSGDLDAVILRRGSTRIMDASATVRRERSSTGRWPSRCAALECRTSSPSTASRGRARALPLARHRHARCAPAAARRAVLGLPGAGRSAATPRSS